MISLDCFTFEFYFIFDVILKIESTGEPFPDIQLTPGPQTPVDSIMDVAKPNTAEQFDIWNVDIHTFSSDTHRIPMHLDLNWQVIVSCYNCQYISY